MASSSFPALINILEERCAKSLQRKSAILFCQGEDPFGIFVVFSGQVTLDFGVPRLKNQCYGPGALLGLPATLTRQPYCMTAIVTEDAKVGFMPYEKVDLLLRECNDIRQQVLNLLGETLSESRKVAKALLSESSRKSPAIEQGLGH
jgi:CRP-like cAMP-binding protein